MGRIFCSNAECHFLSCDRFFQQKEKMSLPADGHCPTCGRAMTSFLDGMCSVCWTELVVKEFEKEGKGIPKDLEPYYVAMKAREAFEQNSTEHPLIEERHPEKEEKKESTVETLD